MDWVEVTIDTKSEAVEVLTAVLMDLGINGMQIEDDGEFIAESKYWDYVEEDLVAKHSENKTIVKIFLSEAEAEVLVSLKTTLAMLKNKDLDLDLGTLDVQTKNVNDEDWLNEWKKYYKPLQVGEKIVIRPEWEPYENVDNKIVFSINPGHIFGTGLHQSTQLCIRQLENYVKSGDSVIDLGCGSGILSIISILLGASDAYAIDIDPNAVKVAYENARLNGIYSDQYTVESGNILEDESKRGSLKVYDIAVANIIADVIVDMASILKAFLKHNGYFIASGIITGRVEDVYNALRNNNLEVIETYYQDDWVCVVSRRTGDE